MLSQEAAQAKSVRTSKLKDIEMKFVLSDPKTRSATFKRVVVGAWSIILIFVWIMAIVQDGGVAVAADLRSIVKFILIQWILLRYSLFYARIYPQTYIEIHADRIEGKTRIKSFKVGMGIGAIINFTLDHMKPKHLEFNYGVDELKNIKVEMNSFGIESRTDGTIDVSLEKVEYENIKEIKEMLADLISQIDPDSVLTKA